MPVETQKSVSLATARLFVSLTVLSVGVAATLATILAFFGSLWWAFDTINGVRLHLAILLLLVAGAFRVGFGLATGALFLAAALVNAVIVAPVFLGSATDPDPDAGTLKVASVPVEETGQDDAMDWVIEAGVDIAFLLDTDDTWSGLTPPAGSGYKTVDQVFVGRQNGITVIARTNLDVSVDDRRTGADPLIRAEAKIGDREIAIYAVLLAAPGSDAETSLRNDVLEEIARQVAAEVIPVAVLGPLGTSQWSHAFGLLTADSVLVDSSPGNGYQSSNPGGWWLGLRMPLHHLLHTDSLTTTERHIDAHLGQGTRILQATLANAAS